MSQNLESEDKMKRLVLSATAALMLASPAAVSAQETDMAKLSCQEFMTAASNEQHMGILLAWIDGYMSAVSENTVMSDEWMGRLGQHMATWCQANPQNTIMDAMEAMPEE